MQHSAPSNYFRYGFLLCLLCGLTACTAIPVVDVPSANYNSRIQSLVFHFTSLPFDESLHVLTEPTDIPVSVHYLVPEPGDPTYPHRDLKVYRLVPEHLRAWHAGVSHWRGKEGLNDISIGIEIVNQSRCVSSDPSADIQTVAMQVCNFLDYSPEQMDLVIRLTKEILARHPDIQPVNVVAHSDIAPTRRLDPGPLFPWKRFYDEGIGAWYDEATLESYRQGFAESPPSLSQVLQALRAYGYPLDEDANDVDIQFVVRAFQVHFRPELFDGVIDEETVAILFALLEKYDPESVEFILNEKAI
ncbi:MAG: N-acetylmuramoyl-L-alanine amidase [Pseudomonadota bacterium]